MNDGSEHINEVRNKTDEDWWGKKIQYINLYINRLYICITNLREVAFIHEAELSSNCMLFRKKNWLQK
jgi:hypothetical protein